jgi:hypothetical protein
VVLRRPPSPQSIDPHRRWRDTPNHQHLRTQQFVINYHRHPN